MPTSYLSAVDFQTGVEFEKMRYMAVTCDADQVREGRYKLRTQVFNRQIELAVCLTVNEVSFSCFAFVVSEWVFLDTSLV